MILYIALCAMVLAVALTIVAKPLWHSRVSLVAVVVLVPLTAAAFYWSVGHRDWEKDLDTARAQASARKDLGAHIERLERSLQENPNDIEIAMNLVEALVQQDESTIAGRAGQIIETVLDRQPNNATALWYGAIGALSTGRLPVARERLEKILAQNPPQNIRAIIERQIQDIGQQLGERSAQSAATPGPKLNVRVDISPTLASGVDKSTALFVLARDPAAGGPPLAAARRVASDLPLSVTLSDADAMMAGRGISGVSRIQVVARISKSGTPQAQVGDLYGEAFVDVGGQKEIAVKITIDRKVEK